MTATVLSIEGGWRSRFADGAVVATALGLACLAKAFYSRATFDQLLWVLAPTTRLVEWLVGDAFEVEAHHGFISRELCYEIVPSCAGLNFMIVAFCSLACGLVHRLPAVGGKLVWLVASAVAAYITTILANATRIAIAIRLHGQQVSFGPLTPERIHHVEGVVVFFLFLCALFEIARIGTENLRES